MASNLSIVCKKMVFAGHDDFKVIQEIHMGLGSLPNQRESDLYMKYGQKWKKRRLPYQKKLKILRYRYQNRFLARG